MKNRKILSAIFLTTNTLLALVFLVLASTSFWGPVLYSALPVPADYHHDTNVVTVTDLVWCGIFLVSALVLLSRKLGWYLWLILLLALALGGTEIYKAISLPRYTWTMTHWLNLAIWLSVGLAIAILRYVGRLLKSPCHKEVFS